MKLKGILFVLLGALLLTGCERKRKQDVLILFPNWAEGIAITHLAEVILHDKGYTTSLKRLEPGPIYAALSRGDADVYMDAWLPYTHHDYWKRFGHRMEQLGVVFANGITGLVVPTYVDIESIEDLPAYTERFKGKIYGIAAGAGIHTNTEKAIKGYGLDYEQIASSETSMLTALKQAERRKEWVIITGWKPHFMWFKHKLKPLKDPKRLYPTDEIRIVGRQGFSADQPEIADFFAKFILSEEYLGELMHEVEQDKDPAVGARVFYERHKEALGTWLKKKGMEQQRSVI